MEVIRLLAAAACATLAFALDPDRAITQFVHTSWTEKDGAPINARALAQTQDGYLWIGTTAGLFRFDGVRFTAFEPPAGESLPVTRVRRLLATRDGALWIVWTVGPVSRLQNGHLTSYSEKDGLPATTALGESADGTIIAATVKGLSRFERGTWKDVAKEWNFPGKQARALYFDKTGALWVATEDRAVYMPPGQRRFVDPGNAVGSLFNFAQAPDGAVWVSEVGRSAHTLRREHEATPDTEVRVGALWVSFDRDGSLWVGSGGDGLRRVPRPDRVSGKSIAQFGPGAEQFTAKDGLSDAVVVAVLEDREGNIWCATEKGLDRFRQGAFLAVDIPHPDGFRGVFATKDGYLWTLSSSPGEIVRISPNGAKEAIDKGGLSGACEDESGTLWIRGGNQIFRFRERHFSLFQLPHDLELINLRAITCDHAGGVWLLDEQRGLFRLADGGLAKIADFSGPFYIDPILFADSRGRVWLGQSDWIKMFDHGSKRRFGASDGLSPKLIRVFAEDQAENVWVGGDGGLAKFDRDRFRSLSRSNGLPLQSVFGLVEDDDGYWWIACDAGVLRIRDEELDRALSDSSYRVHYELFNQLDGLPGRPAGQVLPRLAKTGDGRVWVATSNGIAYVDPRRIPRNAVPPPVRVESLKVNGKEIAAANGLVLSPGSNDLEIDYTALSFTIPERVRYKYKLEGHDSDWRDVGGRREADYGGLGPKNYRFRVIAANESGVWNEAGASFDFSIAPAYYQTHWFQAACIVAFLASLWGLYRLRLRQVAHQMTNQFNLRLEERVGERTRIARELHDTLLQSFQGLLFELQAARNLFAKRPEDAIRTLDGAIGSAEAAIAEGRDAIQDLRVGSDVRSDLAHLLRATGRELSDAQDPHGNLATVRLTVEGSPQTLSPVLQDEIYRIGREILRNAFHHARATKIETEIRYDDRMLRLRIRDDGIGIDPKVLDEGARPGHWGLSGIRERAKVVGAKLDLWSEAGAGTEVQVSVPAAIAYVKTREARAFRWFRKTASSHGD
jgi:signal transduction histidine kinase/streptogramin lyase